VAGGPSGGQPVDPAAAGIGTTQPWPGSSPAGGGQVAASPTTGQIHVPAPPVSGGQPPSGGGSGPSGGSGGGGGFGATGGGGGGRNLQPVLLGAAAVVAVIAAVAFVLTLGGDDNPGETAGTTAASSDSTAPPVTDAPAETTTTAGQAEGPFVQLDSVELQGDFYLVNFTITGFTPSFDQGGYHSHFYLNDVEMVNAGSNGPNPDDWDLTDATGSFLTKYGPSDLSGRDADQMCSLVADSHHGVAFPDRETGTCIDLPPAQ
jgi:hypothetical protein